VRTNVEGTVSVLQACLAAGVGRAIYVSTYGVYGEPERRPVAEDHPLRPVTAYAITKLAGEQLARYYAAAFGIAVTVLRYANVYGPRQTAKGEGGVVGVFAYQARAGQPLTIAGDGSQTRDFVYVGDVAAANVLALERGVGETFNISSGVETSIAELAALLGPLAGAPAAPVFVPPRPVDIYRIAADPTRAAETLGWRPSTALRDGLRHYLAWLDGAGP
jgi:UDP-glucose 4-epimerase